MLHRNALAALLGLPLVVAALVASATYAWATFTVEPEPVEANGAALQDKKGVAMMSMKIGDVEYLVISSHSRNLLVKTGDPVPPEPCHFITIYELSRNGNKIDLRFVGSRCVEWDNGFDLINFTGDKGTSPAEMRNRR